jgi:hypothetical protein
MAALTAQDEEDDLDEAVFDGDVPLVDLELDRTIAENVGAPEGPSLPTRIVTDALHAMMRITPAASHPLKPIFMSRFRDTLFTPDLGDKTAVLAFLGQASEPLDWDQAMKRRSDWILKRVRRYIGPAAELHQALKTLFEYVSRMLRDYLITRTASIDKSMASSQPPASRTSIASSVSRRVAFFPTQPASTCTKKLAQTATTLPSIGACEGQA